MNKEEIMNTKEIIQEISKKYSVQLYSLLEQMKKDTIKLRDRQIEDKLKLKITKSVFIEHLTQKQQMELWGFIDEVFEDEKRKKGKIN